MSCPPETPILCGPRTVARGLCVSVDAECSRQTREKRALPKTNVNDKGARYGYLEADLGRGCYYPEKELKLDYEAVFSDGEPVGDHFSFLTYNIWGLSNTERHQTLFTIRKPLLEKVLTETNADLCFLQEMSDFSYGKLSELIGYYTFASEVPYPSPRGAPLKDRNRNVEVYCMSQKKPNRIRVFGVRGVLGYENSMMVVEYSNLVVVNLYNQAGSRHSPGQEQKWIHYSRCRYDILQTIYELFKDNYKNINCILCGDFNFDLDGNIDEWPEMEMLDKLKALGFIDTFRKLNPTDPGYTEDTDRNFMRWNQKLIKKQFRYDGVFYRPPPPPGEANSKGWGLLSAKLIGLEEECLSKENSQWFLENMTDPTVRTTRQDEMRGCKTNSKGAFLLPINPSDHFGVVVEFGRMRGGRRNKTRKAKKV